ncbi:translationally-controlled tumor protein [Streptomyces sp. NPDC014894]|uniref:translationally-controlled tumor protein n=1 Tax=Streptomyces sp. NPDC014894 TaxID=3364931 RepID=UPI0036FD09DE
MKVFRDIISQDELASDAFDITEVNDGVFSARAAYMRVSPGVDLGGDSSQGEADDKANQITVINIVDSFRLVETEFTRETYTTYIKGYLKKIKAVLGEANPDRVGGFEPEAAVLVKRVLADFDNYTFYTGESMDPEGMAVPVKTSSGGDLDFYFFRDGLLAEKV